MYSVTKAGMLFVQLQPVKKFVHKICTLIIEPAYVFSVHQILFLNFVSSGYQLF